MVVASFAGGVRGRAAEEEAADDALFAMTQEWWQKGRGVKGASQVASSLVVLFVFFLSKVL